MQKIQLVKTILVVFFVVLFLYVVRLSVFGQIRPEQKFFFEVGFLLMLAAFGEYIVSKTKLPSVLVLMVLGIMMSNSVLELGWGVIEPLNIIQSSQLNAPQILRIPELIRMFAQFGAVMFLFKIGLENRTEEVFKKDNFYFAIFSAILPFLAGFGAGMLIGGDFGYCLFLGAALTGTNLGVNVAVLRDLGLMKEQLAKIILGAAVIDDAIGLFVLSVVVGLTSTFAFTAVFWNVLLALFFIVACLLFGEYFLKYLDRNSFFSSRRFLFVLMFAMFYAFLADYVGLT